MAGRVRLGTSGWHYAGWQGPGLFYPEKLPKGRWLEHYCKIFDTVEVNSTFYRLPAESMLLGWYRKSPKGFLFAFKANRLITHVRGLRDVGGLLKRFYQLVSLTKEKEGPVLFQTPPRLKKDLGLLEAFLKQLDKRKRNVIEFRHISWYSDDVYELLSKHKTGFCIVSCPDFPTVLKVTADFAYIRFHGKLAWYRSSYSDNELRDWAGHIRRLAKKADVFGYFNNDWHCYAPQNCAKLKKFLKL
jgi:uncharacterized protein YecE (DUF72 family)